MAQKGSPVSLDVPGYWNAMKQWMTDAVAHNSASLSFNTSEIGLLFLVSTRSGGCEVSQELVATPGC